MGKGDRKTLKGKRYNSSYGNSRAHSVAKPATATQSAVTKKSVVKPAAKKAVVKKTVAKG